MGIPKPLLTLQKHSEKVSLKKKQVLVTLANPIKLVERERERERQTVDYCLSSLVVTGNTKRNA